MCLILLYFGAAKRIRTPDPRITNSQIFLAVHIDQYLTNTKCDLCQSSDGKICSWWYKSGYSKRAKHQTTDPSYAASFSFGLSPARAANRTSKSMLNRSILPRFRSDTRA